MTWIWLIVIAVCLALIIGARLVYLDRKRLDKYQYRVRRFYDRIKPVVDDDETPDEVLETIKFLSDQIDDPNSARLLHHVLTLEPRTQWKDERSGSQMAFFERRPELFRPFAEAVSSGLLAITYLDRWRGSRARARMMIIRRHKDLAPIVAKDFHDESDGDINHHPPPRVPQPA